MSGSTMQCSNCGTVNEAGRDTCVQCGQPLTGSADEGARTQLAAQDRGALTSPQDTPIVEPGANDPSPGLSPLAGPTALGAAEGAGGPPLLSPEPDHPGEAAPRQEGRPPRRS